MIVRFLFKVLIAWRRAMLACRLRDPRSRPPRSREVGLLRECARGLATIEQVPSEAGNDRSIFFQSPLCLAQGCACQPGSRPPQSGEVGLLCEAFGLSIR